MKFNKLLVVSIFLLAILTVGAASAADENITDTTDEVLSAEPVSENLSADTADDVELEASTGDFAELQSLVDNTASGKTLKLNKDYSNINSNSYVKISKAITIDGQGHTIDGKKSGTYIFYITTTNKVTLKNINFVNSKNSAVKGYSSSYKVTVNNCSFVDCSASGSYAYGGAIYYGDAYNCSFVGCSASGSSSGYGGAIFSGNAYNCSFVGCSASGSSYADGGAIYYGDAYNCSFVGCSASCSSSGYGGAIYYGDAYNCSFVGCSASGSYAVGGAIYSGSATDCSFIDCYAPIAGGAIYSGNAKNSYFRNCSTKSSNAAMAGGKATNCTFVECQASAAIFSIRASDITYGSTAYIYVNGDENVGYVNVTVNGETKKIKPYYNGNHVSFSGLAVGTYQAKVTYPGSANFKAQTATTTFKVNKQNPISEIHTNNPYSYSNNHRNYGNVQYTGGSATLYIYMRNSNVPGNVKVCINGETQKVQISKSTLTLPLGVLTPGSYNISVSYAGNANFNAQNISLAFKVIKANPISAIRTDYPYAYSSGNNNYGNVQYDGRNATLTINMNNNNVPGNVNVTINGVSQKVKVSGYDLKVPLGVLKIGNYNITVSYAGSAGFKAQTMSLAFKVIKQEPITSIGGIPSDKGQRIFSYSQSRLYVYLKNTNVPGSINVTINGASYIRNTTGRSAISFSLGIMKLGHYDIKVEYAGSDDFSAQTLSRSFDVVKRTPIYSIRVYTPDYSYTQYYDSGSTTRQVNYNAKEATLQINLNSMGYVNGKYKYAPGKVHVTVNGASHKALNITGSSLTLPLGILNLGMNEIKVYYSGSAYCNAQNISIKLNVVKSNPIKSVELPASTVGYGDNASIKVNMLNDKINGNVWYTISDENKTKILTDKMKIVDGVASFEGSKLELGKYYLHIYFAGNDHYNAQTIKKTFKVVKKTPILSVDVSSYYGENTTIKVKVNNVNGNVWFTVSDENRTKILTDKMHIEDSMWATREISGLGFGKYYLHLYYAGNVHYSTQTLKSTFVVDKKSPISSVSISEKGVGEDLNISVKMFDNKVNGNVWITITHAGNTTKEKISIKDGFANYTIQKPTTGRYDFTLSYSGSAYYKAQSVSTYKYMYKSSANIKVTKTTVNGRNVLSAKLPKYADGNVKFEVNGSTYTVKLTDGVASLTLPTMAPGTYTLKTTYGGNDKVYSGTNTRSITIK